jgi:hypothetical protein
VAHQGVSRTARYVVEFEAAQDEFIRLVESLTDEQWARVGKNHPQRLNDEDEGRTVGVIADHVAQVEPFILERIQLMIEGKPMPPVDFRAINAKHAAEHSRVSRPDVLKRLREHRGRIAEMVRAIPDSELDLTRDTPAGPMSVAQRLERVLIGHIKTHQGSIEAAIS